MQTVSVSPEQLTGELLGFIGYVMKRAQSDVLHVAAGLDLSLSQLRVLHVLDARERPLALHELADAMGLSVAATGRAVDALVRTGMVSRREDDADRRVKRIALAEPGRDAVIRLIAARRTGMLNFVETLSDEERDLFSRALAPVLARPEVKAVSSEVCR